MGESGIDVVNVANPAAPQKMFSYPTPAALAEAVAAVGSYVMIAEGIQGVNILDTNTAVGPLQVGQYETPGEASPVQVLRGIFSAVTGNFSDVQAKVWRTLGVVLFDLMLFIVLLILWLAFFAQFSLPVHTLSDRKRAIDRLISYHLGSRGPAIFIENGEVKERAHEEERMGPGVALLDTASAAMFRTRHAFTRPAGPGITFTNPGEYLAGTVDLHRQSNRIGPEDRDNPFDTTTDQPSGEAERRQKRR
jgi:hypothetical protein